MARVVCQARQAGYGSQIICVPHGRDNGGLTLHTLRHTCATNLVRADVHIKTIARLLGDTVETIASTYLNLDTRDATAGLEKGLRFVAGD